MTRSEFDDIRAHIADEEGGLDDLLQIAGTLLDDLEQARVREATLRASYAALLAAAKATVASDAVGDPNPLTFLRHELSRRRQLPSSDEEMIGILADARMTATPPSAHLEDPPSSFPRSGPRMRRCAGTSRRLPH